ncbi:hypothetical protein RFI_01116 [Reticulomyxa filosa]|uniref:Uncharacterized protein n=1 Tax=Reticulomyxa filosa TaxID=46433 RepID=X6PCN0_RETFI|nr:hypothetical protein RFI_01116 [Reticulomyxa filosa]|eukprot:ETO35946.1 hypothetical protein RFI_01116 [Reticulomyxa filosa]
MLRIWTVDAFTHKPFAGNPASVCILTHYDEALCVKIAREMNHAETAFLVPKIVTSGQLRQDSQRTNEWYIRYWSPRGSEVNYVGHATLASAHVLFSQGFAADVNDGLLFRTKSSGNFQVFRNIKSEKVTPQNADLNPPFDYIMDFPAVYYQSISDESKKINTIKSLEKALNLKQEPTKEHISIQNIVTAGEDLLVELNVKSCLEDMKSVKPDISIMKQNELLKTYRCIAITSKNSNKNGKTSFDIVSRVFGPKIGIDEDAVSGKIHCCLGIYWGSRLGTAQAPKSWIHAYQASNRGGELYVKLDEKKNRVLLNGSAVTMMQCDLLVQNVFFFCNEAHFSQVFFSKKKIQFLKMYKCIIKFFIFKTIWSAKDQKNQKKKVCKLILFFFGIV